MTEETSPGTVDSRGLERVGVLFLQTDDPETLDRVVERLRAASMDVRVASVEGTVVSFDYSTASYWPVVLRGNVETDDGPRRRPKRLRRFLHSQMTLLLFPIRSTRTIPDAPAIDLDGPDDWLEVLFGLLPVTVQARELVVLVVLEATGLAVLRVRQALQQLGFDVEVVTRDQRPRLHAVRERYLEVRISGQLWRDQDFVMPLNPLAESVRTVLYWGPEHWGPEKEPFQLTLPEIDAIAYAETIDLRLSEPTWASTMVDAARAVAREIQDERLTDFPAPGDR